MLVTKTVRATQAVLRANTHDIAWFAFLSTQLDRPTVLVKCVLKGGEVVMRQTKRASKKRSQLAKEAQDTETRIERLYQDAATTGLKAMSSNSVGEFNDGVRQIAEEMNSYSVRSLEQVFHAWQEFLDAGPLRQVFELQAQYVQNAQNAYDAYVDEISRLGEMYLDVTRRVSKPLALPKRAK